MKYGALAVLLAVSMSPALGQTRTRLYQWSSGLYENTDYRLYHEDKQIQILTGYPSKTFWFESCEEQWTGDSWEYIGPGDIDRIYVEWANPMVNQVNIWIRGNGHVWGARDVRFIDLDYCNLSDLKILTISGNLGYTALWGLDRVGSVHVGGSLLNHLHASEYIYSTIAIDGNLSASIVAPSMGGLQVLGSGPHSGNVALQQTYAYTIGLSGNYTGAISLGNSLTGKITIGNNLTGSIRVHNDLNAGGLISVGGDVSGSIKVDDRLAGQIRVNGSLLNGAAENDVWIGTAIDTTGAVAVDYNGWHTGDDWAAGAVVRVGANTYTQNTAAARVYEITPCRGDLNNDGSVDFGDINPFVLALTNPAGFATTYPGLDGSMVFHGDLDCNGILDFGDVNPFVQRMAEQCCWEQCGACPPPGNAPPPPMPEPAELAAILAANIDPELYDDLIALAAAVAQYDSDPEVAAYWQDVYEALTQ